MQPITIETHHGITVVRDDKLVGGTKSELMPHIITTANEYVYASPVYGGFQIALSAYCQQVGKTATIVCAQRKVKHENTITCIGYGANVIEVRCGYLSVIEKYARDYALVKGATKLVFGAKQESNIRILSDRVRAAIDIIGHEPTEIFCAIGSGTLVESILAATTTSRIVGVQVGKEYTGGHNRLKVLKHTLSYEQNSKFVSGFKSVKNYDLKAFEYCVKYRESADTMFWNVM